MILIENANRIVTVNWDRERQWLAVTAIKPDQDPDKVHVKTIRFARADALKLAEFIEDDRNITELGSIGLDESSSLINK